VREYGRIVSIAAIIATGVNTNGRREILGLGLGGSESACAPCEDPQDGRVWSTEQLGGDAETAAVRISVTSRPSIQARRRPVAGSVSRMEARYVGIPSAAFPRNERDHLQAQLIPWTGIIPKDPRLSSSAASDARVGQPRAPRTPSMRLHPVDELAHVQRGGYVFFSEAAGAQK